MSLFGALRAGSGLQHAAQAFPGVRDCTTDAMRRAVEDWFGLYYASCPAAEEDPCQQIPVTVVAKLRRACFAEYEPTVSLKGPAGEFLTRCQQSLDAVRGRAVQLAMIGGECWLKPLPRADRFDWAVVRRDAVTVLARDAAGQVTDLILQEVTRCADGVFTLLERRAVDAAGYLTVYNRLFRSADGQGLGVRVGLETLPQYAALQPEYTWPEPLGGLGLVPLRMPMENTVDGSPGGVSIYAAAAGLIHNINHNEWLLDQEFDHGAIRVFASDDLIRKRRGADGEVLEKRLMPGLFTGLDDDPETVGITVFSPTLRDQSFLARKTEYLRNVESVIGLQRGLLSQVDAVQRTATEVASSAGDYSLTVQDLWAMWERADRQALALCSVLGRLYRLCDAAKFDPQKHLSIQWGNGVLYDRDKDNAERLAQVQAGLLAPELYLAWYYDLPCDTPADRQEVRRRYMPEMEALLEE